MKSYVTKYFDEFVSILNNQTLNFEYIKNHSNNLRNLFDKMEKTSKTLTNIRNVIQELILILESLLYKELSKWNRYNRSYILSYI